MRNKLLIFILLICVLVLAGVFFVKIFSKKQPPSSSVTAPSYKTSKEYIEFQKNIDTVAATDKDFDGIPDADEVKYGTDPNLADTDGDGVLDKDEIELYKTDPLKADTDGDGLKDGWELRRGKDPKNSKS